MQPYAPYPLNLLRDGCHRRRWVIRGVLAVILVPWLFFWTYERLTAMPAIAGIAGGGAVLPLDPGLNVPPPDVDKTKELTAAINALPPLPTIQPLPAPPDGMKWEDWNENQSPIRTTLDTSVVLDGPWQPERRLQQMLFIEYLEDPAVLKALDKIAALSDQPACLTHSSALGTTLAGLRYDTRRIFPARSRYHAEQGHHDAALHDLQTIIKLGDNLANDGLLINALFAFSFYGTAFDELIRQARTLPQPAEHRHAVLRSLVDLPIDPTATYQAAGRREVDYGYAWLDGLFTKDLDGDGLYTVDSTAFTSGADQFRRVENLVSWIYDDRQAHVAFLEAAWGKAFPEACVLPYPRARDQFDGLGTVSPPTHVTPLTSFGGPAYWIARGQAARNITLATLAALTYHADHGHYPDQLADLVPDYLDEIPNDPFVDQPLRYRLDTQYGFIVYSVGENMTDNGGQFQNASGEDLPHNEIKDFFFGQPVNGKWRGDPYEEWILVPESKSEPGS